MKNSIFNNPKIDQNLFTLYKESDGLWTKYWRKRCTSFFESCIPKHVKNENKILLTNPQQFSQFINNIKLAKSDLSQIEYLCIVEPISDLYDIIEFFTLIKNTLPDSTKIMYTHFNWSWYPIFRMSGITGLTRNRPYGNFYSNKDLDTFLDMTGWENVKKERRYIFPKRIPLLSYILENFILRIPIINFLSVNTFFIARKTSESNGQKDYSISILIPCKNEEKNIYPAVKRIPGMGSYTELIFINDKSTDGTEKEIQNIMLDFPEKNIVFVQGKGKGKGSAVREGIKKATGDICMILDADLTVTPEDLPQFYNAMKYRRADFVHGTRMVYAQKKDSMRFANIIGNLFFSYIFSYILNTRTTDTLCGTKVFWRRDWHIFEEMRQVLGNKDIWGDYNLIFGASRYGLKIAQLPVRYFDRLEGKTKMMNRLKNGLIMLKISWLALWKVKFL